MKETPLGKKFDLLQQVFPCAAGDLLMELAEINLPGSKKQDQERHIQIARATNFSNRMNIFRSHKWPPPLAACPD